MVDVDTRKTIAERIFDGEYAKGELEEHLSDLEIPFEDISWDWYDCSLEIYGLPPEYRCFEPAQRFFHKAGFAIAYVNHTDGWETHYHFNPVGEFELDEGWRVSYPHKRDDGTGDILLEKEVPTWPEEWYKTGYARVINTEENIHERTWVQKLFRATANCIRKLTK